MPGRGPGAKHSLGSGVRMREQPCCPPHPTLASSSMPQHEMAYASLRLTSVDRQVWPHQAWNSVIKVSSLPSSDIQRSQLSLLTGDQACLAWPTRHYIN